MKKTPFRTEAVRSAVAYVKHNAMIKPVTVPTKGYRVYYGGFYRHQSFTRSWDGAIEALMGYYKKRWRDLNEAAVMAEMRRQFGEKDGLAGRKQTNVGRTEKKNGT